ncbi:MAG: hypothetical protein IK068_01490, partial [Lachnospiraceae bacterium]|nr:hypothetical protein [Lachnospiraceae bacterium]
MKSLPLYQKKCTMMDALCQAIESWWSRKANEESIAYSKEKGEKNVNLCACHLVFSHPKSGEKMEFNV